MTEQTENVKNLRIHNFKNIEHADIKADGNSFVLYGENGAGKSAHIEALGYALKGVPSKLVRSVIRDGEKSTFVFLDTGSFLITREQEDGKPAKLIVKDQEGVEYKSPQKMLNDLFSQVTFDPGAFMALKDKEQLETLRNLIDADGKIAKMEEEEDRLCDLRKVANAEDKRLKTVFQALTHDKEAPKELVSHADLLKDYEGALDVNLKLGVAENTISQAERAIKELESEISQQKKLVIDTQQEIQDIGDPPDIESKKTALDNAESINERVRSNQAYDKASDDHRVAISKAMTLQDQVEEKREEIKKAVKDSDMPVEGMTFGKDKLLLNGRDLKSCSTGEQIVASLKISMALNKGLKTIMIKDGSLLDEQNRQLVMDFAKENGFQVIMEVVKGGKSVTVEIEGV